MKHFTKLFIGILFLILGGTQSGFAQFIDDMLLKNAVDPATVAGTGEYVYLYNVDEKKFVHGGGEYGMQSVLSERGIRFKVVSASDGGYYLESAIVNKAKGSCLAIDLGATEGNNSYKTYVDRPADEYANLHFDAVRGQNNIYYLRTTIVDGSSWWQTSTNYYYHFDKEYVHAGEGRSADNQDKWCLIKRDDYNEILKTVAEQGRYNITGLIGNSRFLRNVSDRDNKFWSVINLEYGTDDYCTTIDPNLGTTQANDGYAANYGAFGCVEIGAVNVDNGPVEFYQTITGLKPGLYMVEAQAFFDKNDYATYKNGAYNNDNTTGASNAYLFANGEETLIPVLNSTDQATFENYTTELKDDLDRSNKIYFRRNVAAAYFLAQRNAYEPDESYHRVRVYVNVTADKGQETGTLNLGVNKKGTEGRVYVDNFGLYYIGQNEIGLDAYQRDVNKVDQNKYQQQYPFHLSRKFVLSEKDPINPENDKWNWNAITLPMDVYASQITETFGEDAKLCKLEGVNPQNKDQILFTPVDLSDYSKPAIERGGCYLICVTKGPEFPEGEAYKFLVKKENDPEQTSQNMEFPYGNIYTITGVSCPEGMVTPVDNTVEVTTDGGTLSYTYFYHRPGEKQGDTPVPEGSYVMSGGKMYHLSQAWDGLLGTCWYITDKGTSSNSKVLAIDGEGGTTDINGIVTELPGDNAHEGVYNINGQKVADGTSLKNLPKGIYIMNGKKYVIK